jgi:glycosyltransferase involved in cell wall biosynthesis
MPNPNVRYATPTFLRRSLTRALHMLHDRKLATWEMEDANACVLIVTNAWPHPENPTNGPFVHSTVNHLRASGVPCDVLFVRGNRGWRAYLLSCFVIALLSLGRRGKYRLVHSHGGETALVARFFYGAPVLASYLGSDLLAPREGNRRDRTMFLLRSMTLRFHSRLMTATTTKSREMEGVLPRRTQRRNWIIPDGVDRDLFCPIDRDEARRQLNWPRDEIIVISVGNRVPLKRLWLAEEATTLAAQQAPNLRWRIISGVAPEKMPLLYSAADCLVHTSASEGSPNVVKEALTCNLPVVATPAGDIAELLSGVSPSALCAPHPEILARELLLCVAGRKRSNGRELARHVDVNHTTAQTLDCYASLVGTRLEATEPSGRGRHESFGQAVDTPAPRQLRSPSTSADQPYGHAAVQRDVPPISNAT